MDYKNFKDVVLDINRKGSNVELYADGLTAKFNSGGRENTIVANRGKTKGKWYYETKLLPESNGNCVAIGICTNDINISDENYKSDKFWGYLGFTGEKFHGLDRTSYGGMTKIGYTIGVMLDLNNHELSFIINGENKGVAYTTIPNEEIFPCFLYTSYSGHDIMECNFGNRPFEYLIPKDYLPYDNINKYLLKQNNQYYSIQDELYDINLDKYIACEKNYRVNGFENLSELTKEINELKVSGYKNNINNSNIFEFNLSNKIKKIEML